MEIPAYGLPDVNNDHVLAPDGATVFASANDWHIWEVALTGGEARRVTVDDGGMHFLHGISPDGRRLGYVRLDPEGDNWWASATIHTVGVDGQGDVAVTTDPGPADGCEWTPDGEWIVFNTEQFSNGHAQLARVRPDGTELEQLTFDERVNWFPHVAPTGDVAVYLSYPPGTTGHPADRLSSCGWSRSTPGRSLRRWSRSTAGRERSTCPAGRRTDRRSRSWTIPSTTHSALVYPQRKPGETVPVIRIRARPAPRQ